MFEIAIIYLIISIAFFGGSLEGYNLVPPAFNWLTEPLIYLLFASAITTKRARIRLPFLPFMLLFLFIGASSVIVNHQFNLKPLFGLRLILRFYIFFLALVNLDLTDVQIKRINKLLIYLFIIQIPVAAIKFITMGQQEATIGTYATHGGVQSTTIPLLAIGYLLAFYIYYRANRSFILLSLGFVFYSFIAGKRALVFMLPVLVGFLVFMFLKDRDVDLERLRKMKIRVPVLTSALIVLVVFFGLKYVSTLNKERSHRGSVDIGHALKYAIDYNTSVSGLHPGYSIGRYSTTKQIFKVMKEKGYVRFLYGYGPGAYTRSRFADIKTNSSLFKGLRI